MFIKKKISNLWAKPKRSARGSRATPSHASRVRHLALEPLEDRRLLAFTPGVNRSTGTQLTSYTLALATTAEFTQSAGGKAATQSLLNRFVVELNKIYESELAITLQLHPKSDALVFENAATDGYTNGSNAAMLDENAGVINTALNGSATNDSGYDFGHVFGIGADGGRAGIGEKADAASNFGIAQFTLEHLSFAAHEIAHQMSALHSHNSNQSPCSQQRDPISGVEPGGGSTIMSYSGSCGSDNLTEFPGDGQYFHAISFDQIIDFTSNTAPQRGTRISTGNTLPAVNAGTDRTIPAATPFALTAIATDPDAGDRLTYTWEQTDVGNAASVPISDAADNAGPLFRSLAPSVDATRVFPRIQTILANTPSSQNKDEHLPTQNRAMNFRLTVRDNHQFNGKTVSGVKSDDVKLNVVNTGAPFRVTSLNGPQTITGASQQIITWNVAGTDSNGINTTKVDILLSIDGGLTYPNRLVSQTNNDGSETVQIPNVSVAKARIKVQADPTQNVFFDINDADLQINQNPNVPGGIIISESGGSTKVAEGLFVQTGLSQTDTYTVALTQPPAGAVTVTITANAQTRVSLDGTNFASSQTVTFNAGDASAKTVTIIAIDDVVAEGFHMERIRHAVNSSADPNYSTQILTGDLVQAVAANISDDDAPPLIGLELDFPDLNEVLPTNWNRAANPFTVSQTNLIRENADSTAIDFTLSIANSIGAGWSDQTMDTLTIPRHTPALDTISDVMFWENATLTGTWSELRPNSKYRVYVMVASEALLDDDVPINQTVAITGKGNDNPAPFVQDGTGKFTGVDQTKALQLFVNGTLGNSANALEQFGVLVTSTLDGKVTVKVTPTAGTPAVLSALAIQEFFEPIAGITITETDSKTEVSEAGTSDTFLVQLDAQPTGNVVLDVTSVNTAAATVDKSTLVFTSTNWNVPQVVTVTGVNDIALDGDQVTAINVTVNVAQSDSSYATVASKEVAVTTKDDDQANFTKVESGGKTEVSETATTDSFTVVLTAQPTSNVVLNVASSNTAEASVDLASLTFTTTNWNQPQTVTVTGVDDLFADGDKITNVTLSINAAQSDSKFNAVAAQVVAVTTKDNEQVGVTIVESNGKTEVSEAGGTDSFTIALSGPPASNVILNLAAGNTSETTIDKASLTFTPADWNQPQTVTVAGVDDQKVDGSVNSVITASVDVAQSDNAFDLLPNQTVMVTTADDDQAGFAVAESNGNTEVNETVTTDTFTVVLSKQPIADVVFTVTSANTGEATVDKPTLTFTSANWDTAQVVTVSGVQDNVVDGEKTVVIAIAVDVTNSQPQFGSLSSQSVNVKVVDSGQTRPWQNTANRFDVSGDGKVAPLDVLQIFNELNDSKHRDAQGKLPDEHTIGTPFYDVNGDGFATTNDAVQLINFLNSLSNGEGESAFVVVDDEQEAARVIDSAWAMLLAAQEADDEFEDELDSILDDLAEWGQVVQSSFFADQSLDCELSLTAKNEL